MIDMHMPFTYCFDAVIGRFNYAAPETCIKLTEPFLLQSISIYADAPQGELECALYIDGKFVFADMPLSHLEPALPIMPPVRITQTIMAQVYSRKMRWFRKRWAQIVLHGLTEYREKDAA